MKASTTGNAVTYRSADRIATITIDRAERMNRIDADVVEGLHAAWHRFMGDDEARVAILTGAGEKAFTAGADLRAPPANLYRGIPGVGVPVDKPVIGAVAGWVVGGGMVLTTMCDILVAADTTRFSYPEVRWASPAASSPTSRAASRTRSPWSSCWSASPSTPGAPTRWAT
jgi:enoyl-CoA hydratase/carnithine racemase